MRERNYAAFWATLKKMPHVDKETLISEWTQGRTTSLREMSEQEYSRMLRHIKQLVDSTDELRRARSLVLNLMQQYGVDTTDWGRVNEFTQQRRIAGKHFAGLSIEELKALSRKLRSMLAKQPERPHRPYRPEQKTEIITYVYTNHPQAEA